MKADCRIAETLYEALDVLETLTDKGPVFVRSGSPDEAWSFRDLVRAAAGAQLAFAEAGVRRGERVALLSSDPCRFLVWFLGAVRGGVVPVPMAPAGSRGSLPRLRTMLARAEVTALVGETATRSSLLTGLAMPELRWFDDGLPTAPERALARADVRPEDTCFLQFTSGSTGSPRAFLVRHANLAANARLMLSHALCLQPGDLAVSWLPMHHDMGLVGMALTPLLYATPVVFMTPSRFVRSPAVWMETISRYRATISFGPNFAFDLAARRVKAESVRELDLSSLRVLGCGAEPINQSVLSSFFDAYAAAGLRWEAIVPCYGLAEATLGVAFDIGQGPRRLLLDRARYEQFGEVAPCGDATDPTDSATLVLVSCGTTSAGHELAIFEGERRLPEGQLGEICFRGPSVVDEYGTPCQAPHGGWLRTGDLGFLKEGQLFVSGRRKDLVIVNGRNFFAQDVEWAAADVPGVRANGVLAVAVEGRATESLLILFESSGDKPSQADQISRIVAERLGIVAAHVQGVPPGRLPRTTSGKLRRQQAKNMWRTGEFDVPESS